MKNRFVKTGLLAIALGLFTITASAQEKREKNEKPPSIEKIFKELDANEDGKLSEKEVKGPLKSDFDKIDLNEDGYLTKEELEKAPKPERRERSRRN